MVSVLPVYAFSLSYLVVCLSFHIISQLLLINNPSVVLTVVSVALLLFAVFVRGQSTI